MDHLSALLQADEEDESVDQGPWDSAQQEDVDEGGSWDEEGGAAEGAAAAGSAAVDLGLSREEVLERIEEFVAGYIKDIGEGKLPVLQFVSRARGNRTYQAARGEEEEDQGEGVAGGRSTQQPQSTTNNVVALGSRMHSRSLVASQGAGAYAYARVFVVLQAVHELLQAGRSTSQRDLYYKLLKPPMFRTPGNVDAAVQDVVALLRVPRSSLGIVCASRGAVAGSLYIRDTPTSPWVDCTSCGAGGKGIPGDITALAGVTFQCSARYLLVVEKDAVFQRLGQDRLWDAVPLVMVTAKGMPDLATRAFCAHLTAQFPALKVLGMVDYNPSGVVILSTYKFGSHRMGLESGGFALPGLAWLGLRSSWLADVEEAYMQPLTQRDRSLLPGLRHSLRTAGTAPATASAAAAAGGRSRTGVERSRGDLNGPGAQGAGGWEGDETQPPSSCHGEQLTTPQAGGLDSGSDADDQAGDEEEGEEESGEEGAAAGGALRPWLQELQVMEATGYKADIESLYSVVGYGGLREAVVRAILRGDWL